MILVRTRRYPKDCHDRHESSIRAWKIARRIDLLILSLFGVCEFGVEVTDWENPDAWAMAHVNV